MAKLKNIIKQLSDKDYHAIHDSLIDSSADKSAYLLKAIREKHLSDNKVMNELGVNNNAYYTLRSRLNQKIEEYLLQQMESPRTDLLKKVANINEIIFTKKRAITVATLQKLEKELIDYDLSNELTIVYKTLKKLHVNSPDHFQYSQAYNKHVAYTLAIDKAEDMLADYFKKFGTYSLTGEERDRFELIVIHREMNNTCRLYNSHRLYVYQSCVNIFHRLFVMQEDDYDPDSEPIEDILEQVETTFNTYKLDSVYYHLRVVFEFLKHEYYNHYRVYKKAEKYYEDVNENISILISNYGLYTFPSQFLITKVHRCLRMGAEKQMYEENEELFFEHEINEDDIPGYVVYIMYRSLSCYYAGKYDEAAKWANGLLNTLSMKRYPFATIEIKAVLALQYCLMREMDLFNQLVSSIQRQIRILGKHNCEHIVTFIKILKTATSEVKRDKGTKIKNILYRADNSRRKLFSPTSWIRVDEELIDKIVFNYRAEVLKQQR